jgi:hypothetical protein
LEEAAFEERERIVKNQVCRAVPKKGVPKHSKIIYSTWVMKKKSHGTYNARLNTRGY